VLRKAVCLIRRREGLNLLAGLLLSLLLCLAMFLSTPGLHRYLHPDASSPGHECLISTFAAGQVMVAGPVSLFFLPALWCVGWACLRASQPTVARDRRLGPSRAPPARQLLPTALA